MCREQGLIRGQNSWKSGVESVNGMGEQKQMYHIGVISDTHGLLREEVAVQLRCCDAILHGGDVVRGSILEELRRIAPLYAVRGNADREWAKDLPLLLDVELFGIRVKLVHNKRDLPEELGDTDLAVFGHSHKYMDEVKGGVRFLNPGSCGPKRFRLPVTMAVAEVAGTGIRSIRRIEITQEETGNAVKLPEAEQDRRKLVQAVMRDVDKGRSVEKIAQIHHIDRELAEQICRMYLTHPGVDIDGILNRMT